MKLNRTDGAGPSRRPELDQDDQPPAQRQRLEISSAAEPSMLNLAPAPRRASPGRGRESTSSHLHGMAPWQASGAVEFQSGAPLRTNAGAPSQFFLSSMFGELPRRGADEPVHMYTQRLLTDHSDLTSRFLNELARMRLSRATLSEADRQRMTRLLANARPRGANESSAAYEERKRVLFTQVAARILGTTTRALLEDLVSMTDRRIEGDANRQNVGPMSSDVRASTPDTAMPASRPHAPAPGPSTQPLPSQGAPSDRLHARLPDRPQQPVASAMPSGRARRQPAPPPPARTNAVAPLSASLVEAPGHLPPQRTGEPNHTRAPAPGLSNQPLAPSQGAPSDRLHARLPDRLQQPAASAMPSGRVRQQPGPLPARTNAVAPLSASLIEAFGHLPPQRMGEPNHTYAYRLYGSHGQQFVPLLHRFASELLPDNDARARMVLATALMATRGYRNESEAAFEQRRYMLGVNVAAELLNTSTNALMLDLASRIAESHPFAASFPVTQQPAPTLAIDRALTRDAVDMLTGMNDEVDLISQTNPHTLAVIDHLGDIGSLPEEDLHPRVLEAVRTASTATQLVMNLRDMVASHPDVLPMRQQAQQRDRT